MEVTLPDDTVVGCLAVSAGVRASDAVAWVRGHYQPSAIEAAAQEQLVARFAAWLDRSMDRES